VLGEVDIDEFAQPRRLDEALLAPQSFERRRERFGRRPLRLEAAALYAMRAAPADAIPVRPNRPAVSIPSPQFENLTLLRHRQRLLDRLRIEEITAFATSVDPCAQRGEVAVVGSSHGPAGKPVGWRPLI
jgi:hypothetical protein